MNKLFASILLGLLILTGCTNTENTKTPNPSTATQPSASVNPNTETDQKEQPIATFSSKSQDKQLMLFKSGDSSLIVKTNGGIQSNVPISKDWEKSVKKETIFSSVSSDSNVYWLLLTSDPAAGQMGKTLYKSDDNGKSWALVNDVSQVIDGYVTGVTFQDDKIGWIGSTQHGAALVPLYRTKDGGKSWSLQEIAIPAGYKYGNAYPPVFNEKDTKQGALKIEFVSDRDTKTIEFKTTDGGETWKS